VAEIRDPVHGYVGMSGPERDIIDTSFLQRLRRVHQLAGSYLVYPGAVHTRFEHVVGTMHTAGQIGASLSATSLVAEEPVEELRMASLLHDVGHGPFSHMFEEVLAERGRMTHEDISQRIVVETQVADVLKKHGHNPKKMSELAVGKRNTGEPFMNEVIAGGMSADMMDYLRRDSYFTGVQYGRVDAERVVGSMHVAGGHLAIDDAALQAFEALLIARYEMFKAVYFHRTVRAAELMLVSSMKLADDELMLTDLSDLDGYIELTDEIVLQRLTTINPSRNELRQAKRLALDFRDRKLVKCVFERLVQRRDKAVGRILGNRRVREQVRSEIASVAQIDPIDIYIDVPTTPSIPYTSSREALTSVRLMKSVAGKKTLRQIPLSDLPLVGSIAGYMDIIRVYTTQTARDQVARAANRVLGDLEPGSKGRPG
jgi:uncharacterized protein